MIPRLSAPLAMVTAFLLSVSAATAQTDALSGTAWLAEDIGGRGVVDRARSTLEFREPGQVGGSSGCNRYFGPVTLQGDAIAFGNLASTRMACPEALMRQEQRFFEALTASTRLAIGDEGLILTLYSDAGEPTLRLSRIVEK